MSKDILSKLQRLGGKAKVTPPEPEWEVDESESQDCGIDDSPTFDDEEDEEDEDINVTDAILGPADGPAIDYDPTEYERASDEDEYEDEDEEQEEPEADHSTKVATQFAEEVAERVAAKFVTALRDALSRVVDGRLYE